MTRDPLVSVENLSTYYEDDSLIGAQPPVKAVDDVSFTIERGETLGLVGESGCGKTTLGRTLLGLLDATDGRFTVDGTDITALSGEQRRDWRTRIGMVFQDPAESLNDRMTVGEIVQEPLSAHDWPTFSVAVRGGEAALAGDATEASATDSPALTIDISGDAPRVEIRETLPLYRDEVTVSVNEPTATDASAPATVTVDVDPSRAELRRERAFRLLDRVGLAEEHFYRYPHQFSGGQRQRVGIARALALEPEFLVLDEPVSALDVSVQARIINLLEELQETLGLTYLFIAHDLSVVRHIADRVAVMYLGNIVEIGPTTNVYQSPQHPYTVSLLSAIPGSGSPWEGERVTLPGTPPSPRTPPEGCPLATRCPAKIRPDDWSLSPAAWKAIDAVQAVLYRRAGESQPVVGSLARRLGLRDGDEFEATVEELLNDVTLPRDAHAVVDDVVGLAAAGETDAAIERFNSTFGSVCETVHPNATQHAESWHSACHRHDDEYADVGETIGSRDRPPVSVMSTDDPLDQ
ncbi:oligopeptide/dipeptide ABC transporter ATP-binding protein [Halorubrum sp. RMP-47]|uniref:Oligopeptide/dipeptide ABC transporter ATP-binding protein n=1 Tax=Halorubrum miltondacostae TaxID=3076378 RepID=A0ABD5M7H8_9EURY